MLFQCGSKPNPRVIDDCQALRQLTDEPGISQKAFQHGSNIRGHRVLRKSQDHDAALLTRWIAAHVSKIQISSDQRGSSGSGTLNDDFVRRRPQPGVAREFDCVAEPLHDRDCRARQVRVQEKSHCRSGSRQWVEGFFRRQVGGELKGRADIIGGEIVLALDIFERHAPGEAPDYDRHRHPGAPDDWLTVQYGRIDDDAVLDIHDPE